MADANQRLISLDVFRGMTIAGMVLVNNPGTWSAIYDPLEHAPWHGITPTDYIFPYFLFIVGVAIPIAFKKRMEIGVTKDVYLKILQRAATIFTLGLLISMIPFFQFNDSTGIPYVLKILLVLSFSTALFLYLLEKKTAAAITAAVSVVIVLGFYFAGAEILWYNFSTMRIPGVLQRIAVCYLIVSLIFLHTNWKQQVGISVVLLLGYWLLMTLIPVPGCEIATIDDKACNLAAWIDRTILTEAHMWRSAKVFDPEGTLSTIPAIVTTLSGVLTGSWITRSTGSDESAIRNPQSAIETVAGLFFAGTVLLAIGWSWSLVFPLNKSLWTSSYSVYTSGLALLTLGFCYWLIDIKGYKRWAWPFVVFGANALALFVFSGLMARLLGMIRFAGPDEGKDITLQQWIFSNIFLSWLAPINASLAYAVCFILVWLFLMWLLYRKQIYIKV
ncbi:MAG TPA: heparan-alpha-glucosaminide N-acetyltransferase domain-containing protein [Pyrinomonadaceae bacterium]|nr:heparan-alpha-glucosaminide N-acetyltransferase domain-containing protein [Pyrinomonadaceae bacterium]